MNVKISTHTNIYHNTSIIKITVLEPLLYMHGGYFSFSILTTLLRFSLILMTKKMHKTVREKEIVLPQDDNYIVLAGQFIIQIPCLITNQILSFLLCSETPNYCCVVL